jgi:hypothetical protein
MSFIQRIWDTDRLAEFADISMYRLGGEESAGVMDPVHDPHDHGWEDPGIDKIFLFIPIEMSDSGTLDFTISIEQNIESNSYPETSTRVLRPEIWNSWIEFVYSTRLRLNFNWELERRQNGNFVCRPSHSAYPHCPPATFQGSFDMIMLLQDRHNEHRRYLAHRMVGFCS